LAISDYLAVVAVLQFELRKTKPRYIVARLDVTQEVLEHFDALPQGGIVEKLSYCFRGWLG
jgi:hypothetical protein